MEKAVVERLRTFGINEMEARFYFTLLNCGAETAGELVNVTGVARADVYKTLNGLLDNGFAHSSQKSSEHGLNI